MEEIECGGEGKKERERDGDYGEKGDRGGEGEE